MKITMEFEGGIVQKVTFDPGDDALQGLIARYALIPTDPGDGKELHILYTDSREHEVIWRDDSDERDVEDVANDFGISPEDARAMIAEWQAEDAADAAESAAGPSPQAVMDMFGHSEA